MSSYDVNYDDERFTQVETEKEEELAKVDEMYGNMISESDQYFQQQIDASKEWEKTQSQIQQDKTDFAIDQIEQQKEQTQKDYIKEQSGAYADWRKQSNEYGAEAEKMAASGLAKTGYRESSQVAMYTAYQNRVAVAREAVSRAMLNYDNAIKDATLNNSSVLAEIAKQALDQQLALALQGFQYKNQLILEQANKKTEIENTYYGRYQDVLAQINHENALAEQIRQYNETMAFNKSRSSGSGGGSGGGATINKTGTQTQTINKNQGYSTNSNSVMALGFGPISDATLQQLLESGVVTRKLINGQWHYAKVTNPYTGKANNSVFGGGGSMWK